MKIGMASTPRCPAPVPGGPGGVSEGLGAILGIRAVVLGVVPGGGSRRELQMSSLYQDPSETPSGSPEPPPVLQKRFQDLLPESKKQDAAFVAGINMAWLEAQKLTEDFIAKRAPSYAGGRQGRPPSRSCSG